MIAHMTSWISGSARRGVGYSMEMRKPLLAAIMLSTLALGCGGSKQQPTAPAPTTEATAHGGMCPMEVQGTSVAVADTDDGVAVTFTTTGDVAELRKRVHAMADMHAHMMHGGTMGSGSAMGSGHMMVPSDARAEDIDGGARIVVTPKDPAQLADLRAHAHEHAAQMSSGHCPMMEHHE